MSDDRRDPAFPDRRARRMGGRRSTDKLACPVCGEYVSTVTNTRPHNSGGVLRRRQCANPTCGARFSTLEQSLIAPPSKSTPAH